MIGFLKGLSPTSKGILGVLLLGSVWFFVHLSLIVVDGLNDEIQPVSLAVVLGNQVLPNGEPSHRLKMRLDRAITLYHKGYFSWILVSGGTGKEGFDEAKVMKRYLQEHKIPGSAIFMDSKGNNTYLTAKHTRRLMQQKKWHSVLLISQYFHISRCKLAFSRFGLAQVHSARAVYSFEWRELYSLFREFFGYYAYWLKSYPEKRP